MRTLQRIMFAIVIAMGSAVAAAPASAQQKFPSKPIRLVVGYGPGTQVDTTARLIGQKISENWGQAVVLDNRPGASGTLAASMVAKAAPDGHTLLQTGVNFVASAAMQPGLPYDPVKDFAGIAHLGVGTQALVVTLLAARPFIKDGKLLALAVTSPQRLAILPEVPALAESLPEFKRPEASSGLLAPAGTPRPILNQISKEIARIFDLPDIKERMEAIGYVPTPSTPEEYDKILRGQIETLSRVVRDAGLRSK